MAYGSLFERLTGETVGRENLPTSQAMSLSIANHISKLLSTRQGSVSTLSDYGVPDLNNIHLSPYDIICQVRSHLQRVISRYEPRLYGARVEYVTDPGKPLAMSFNIAGEIEIDGKREQLSFIADLSTSGQIRIV